MAIGANATILCPVLGDGERTISTRKGHTAFSKAVFRPVDDTLDRQSRRQRRTSFDSNVVNRCRILKSFAQGANRNVITSRNEPDKATNLVLVHCLVIRRPTR